MIFDDAFRVDLERQARVVPGIKEIEFDEAERAVTAILEDGRRIGVELGSAFAEYVYPIERIVRHWEREAAKEAPAMATEPITDEQEVIHFRDEANGLAACGTRADEKEPPLQIVARRADTTCERCKGTPAFGPAKEPPITVPVDTAAAPEPPAQSADVAEESAEDAPPPHRRTPFTRRARPAHDDDAGGDES